MVRASLAMALAAAGVAFLVGCSKPPEPAQTISWYLEHPDAMKAKVTGCAEDLARAKSDDCQNALAANGRKQMGTMKDLPPIDWNAPDQKKP
jgi:hypothetical protein